MGTDSGTTYIPHHINFSMVNSLIMVVKMDRQGRIVIPAKVRRRLGSRILTLEILGDEIRLKPIKPVKLSELFDSIEIGDVEDFTDTHELRRALHD